VQISYAIHDEQEYVSGYGQSYLAHLLWNRDLVSGLEERRSQLGGRIYEGVVDVVEKLGLVHLDQAFLDQDIHSVQTNQLLIKLHMYHWLYDSVACLDSVACILNSKFEIIQDVTRVGMNPRFIESLTSKDPSIGAFLSSEYGWMKELKDMRNTIIHRERRLVTGGGTEPCIVLDLNRAFIKGLPLHRARIPDVNREFTDKLNVFIEKALRIVSTW
jgi:hypothetical protein